MVTINIPAQQAGQSRLELPEYVGKNLIVSRRGSGFLSNEEYSILPEGGIELITDVFYLDEAVTLFTNADVVAITAGTLKRSTQYPDLLKVTTVAETTRDENGDWIAAESSPLQTYPCRAESSTSNGKVASNDGDKIDFSWIVYMPKITESLEIGSKVIVEMNGVTVTDTIKRFSKGFYNCRAWV